MTKSTFTDPGWKPEWTNPVWVKCARCGSRAQLHLAEGEKIWQLTCSSCGLSQTKDPPDSWQNSKGFILTLANETFGVELWLHTTVRNEILIAFNGTHLNAIEDYVRAELREPGKTMTTRSMVQSLPKWMKSAKNRDSILLAIERLMKGAWD